MNAIALHGRPSADFESRLATSVALLRDAQARFAPLTQASSLGAEDMVVTHLLRTHDIAAGVFMLDTGRLHAQTLATRDALERRYGIQVRVFRPDEAALSLYRTEFGEDAIYRSVALRKLCCDIRKTRPLAQALAGCGGWITGLRREQSAARGAVEPLQIETVDDGSRSVQRAKISPLAHWSWGDVWHFIGRESIPYNPLHDQFFPSIGCEPCTRAVTLGEDPRSGRWWWEDESLKECGLHVGGGARVIPIQEISA